MKRISGLTTMAVALMGLALIGAACTSKSGPTVYPEVAAIRAYADPATQSLLQALSEDNLAKYGQNGNAQFKAALTQDLLDKVSAQINSQLGTFVSATFSSTEKQGQYVIVHYKAKYSRGDVGVRMVFDQDRLVAGQFFE